MGMKTPRGTAEEEFARSAWDWSGDLAEGTSLLTQVSLAPTKRKGVWSVRVRALAHVDDKPHQVVAQLAGEWPNSERVDFWGFVLALQMRLSEQVEQDAAGGWLPVQSGGQA
jgi:hypothetical protein